MEIRQIEARDHAAVEQFVARVPEGDTTFFKEDVSGPEGQAGDLGEGERNGLMAVVFAVEAAVRGWPASASLGI
jgi:hypothetical protein